MGLNGAFQALWLFISYCNASESGPFQGKNLCFVGGEGRRIFFFLQIKKEGESGKEDKDGQWKRKPADIGLLDLPCLILFLPKYRR